MISHWLDNNAVITAPVSQGPEVKVPHWRSATPQSVGICLAKDWSHLHKVCSSKVPTSFPPANILPANGGLFHARGDERDANLNTIPVGQNSPLAGRQCGRNGTLSVTSPQSDTMAQSIRHATLHGKLRPSSRALSPWAPEDPEPRSPSAKLTVFVPIFQGLELA